MTTTPITTEAQYNAARREYEASDPPGVVHPSWKEVQAWCSQVTTNYPTDEVRRHHA